jgi:glycosyltransferase involved in cell wall biosynthesis
MRHEDGVGRVDIGRSHCGPNSAMSAPVSVVILTVNEEVNIEACLASCARCDDVHVLDSGSTDRTVEIAERLGASVHRHAFESFGVQRNWAIDNVPLKHEWVFHLDADERFTPALWAALGDLLRDNPSEAGFFVPEKLMFMGRWLKRAGAFPKYQMRLFHKERMRFRDYGHGQREVTEGAIGLVTEPYLHYALSKGLDDWIDKHNRYSALEADRVTRGLREPWSWRALVSMERLGRRRAWKELAYRLPCRATVRWAVTLFVHGGILEGQAGRTYARLMALYEEMTALKLAAVKADASRDRADTTRTEGSDRTQ